VDRVSKASDPQRYVLRIRPDEIAIQASTPMGFAFAVRTLAQLRVQCGVFLPCLDIDDWPDIPTRGVLLDISRDKVPTLRTLREIIDRLASLKLNQIQLYMEHTFAYRGHRRVWRGASPLTAAEVRRLDAYCRERFIELVPCQNSLGHMERWLRHPRYAPLAEATGPWRSPFGDIRTTRATLCPTDSRSSALVAKLLDELLPCFSSKLVNVNCDEPFELGQGRSAGACRRRGVDAVFAEYVRKLHGMARRRGRRMMMWADMIDRHPRLLRLLPRDIILLEWGYEADHPFDRRCREIGRAGFEFYVCPGTSSWCSFAGRTAIARENVRRAALAARRTGARGYLITDWGDFGHRQYWPVSLAPIVFGAAAAWNVAGLRNLDWTRAASLFAFGDSSERAAEPWLALGHLNESTGVALPNRTVLFRVMQARLDDRGATAGLTPVAIRSTRRRLSAIARNAAPQSALASAELATTIRVLRHACDRAEWMMRRARGDAAGAVARRLLADIRAIASEHRRLWRARNRLGGLRDSVGHYGRLAAEYAGVVRAATTARRRDTRSGASATRRV
jgi:hexosaminidase